MQQKENFLFKTIVDEMYKYFISDQEIPTDDKIEELKLKEIYIENTDQSDEDYKNIMFSVVNKINIYNKTNDSSKIKVSDLQEILADFWLDICPVYKLE